MDSARKKALLQEYKQQKTYYGVIQIKNEQNGKIFISAVPNTKNRWHFYQLNLNNNFYHNTPLQEDWNQFGAENFSFEILWEKDTEKVTNMKQELKKLQREWQERLQPYGDIGYNKPIND